LHNREAARQSLARPRPNRLAETPLTFSAFDDKVRSRFSGLLDLEGYSFPQPPPGFIFADGHTLFNPRLSLFLDAQLGPKFYFFGQARFDRGFDPSDGSAEARLDEYALRFTPWDDGRFNVQVGKFSTVVGNWVSRHLSWDNPFINAPLPYENITSVSDADVPPYADEFFEEIGAPGAKYDHNPIIWGPSYTTGASVASRLGKVDLAAEIKNAPLSSRPESWSATAIDFSHPTVSGRVGFRPDEMWNFGMSASDGAYLRPEAATALPPGNGLGDFHQTVIGQDISFAWHHVQLWAEVYESRFDVPRVGNADTLAYYIEAKYKLTAQLFGALRWNQQFFGKIDNEGEQLKWGHDLWRTDAALGYRFTAHTQLKLQYGLQHEESIDHNFSHILAVQFTLRF